MKLLKKNEIDILKAKGKQSEIQEGLKIAKRVDVLRETQADEEASLEKFRKETVSKINLEISSLASTKEELSKEVSNLQDQRKKALIPLDLEWTKLEEEKTEFLSQKDARDQAEEILHQEQVSLSKSTKILEEDKKRIADESVRSQKLLRDADNDWQKALDALAEAEKVKNSALSFKEATEKHLDERTIELDRREANLLEREQYVQDEQLKISKEWTKLKDRKEMEERNIKRFKK